MLRWQCLMGGWRMGQLRNKFIREFLLKIFDIKTAEYFFDHFRRLRMRYSVV